MNKSWYWVFQKCWITWWLYYTLQNKQYWQLLLHQLDIYGKMLSQYLFSLKKNITSLRIAEGNTVMWGSTWLPHRYLILQGHCSCTYLHNEVHKGEARSGSKISCGNFYAIADIQAKCIKNIIYHTVTTLVHNLKNEAHGGQTRSVLKVPWRICIQ